MKKLAMLVMVLTLGLSAPVDAELYPLGTDSLGNMLIYDDGLDITWYDFRYLDFDDYGWQQALDWADSLEVIYGGVTLDQWRLPRILPLNGTAYNVTDPGSNNGSTDNGFNATAPGTIYAGSTATELAHLYYVSLGNEAAFNFDGTPNGDGGLNNTGPFTSLLTNFYWSGNEYDETRAWAFYFDMGYQGPESKNYYCEAMAVYDGDIRAVVPEPATMLLLGTGLVGLVGFRKKFKK